MLVYNKWLVKIYTTLFETLYDFRLYLLKQTETLCLISSVIRGLTDLHTRFKFSVYSH
jgi:hypothetical protein